MKKHSFKRIKKRLVFRVLPFILAFLMLLTSAPVAVFSTDEKTGESAAAGDIIYDYDTLKVTLDGEEISSMSIYPYEKIEISGTGIPENATYQWQIKHPEKNNLWVNIYDAKSDTIGVSAALINNMLAEDGTAKLRLRAYTDDYAYLSNPVTVTLLEEIQPEQTLSVENITFPHAMAGDTSETPEFVTVTINYVKWEYTYDSVNDMYVLTKMGDAFSPYKATLLYNGSLTTTVINPTIIGFDPYVGDATTSADKIEINLSNITEDVVFTVNYKPAKVKYEVNYYFQNIYDDLYAENLTLAPHFKGEGYTGMPPFYREDADGNIIKDTSTKIGVYAEFEGFAALFYQPDTIAADGSTVFEVYFERNYYLMEFDCTGGYGVHTLYVRHGTYISVPNPIRPGYVFAGWDKLDAEGNGDGVADTIPAEMPIGNTAYKALWKTAETTYTVVYWLENSEGTRTYIGSRPVNATSAERVSGSDDLTADTNVCGLEEHTHTDCTVSCGKTEHSHGAGCCSVTEHIHGADCCTVHVHSDDCFSNCTHKTHERGCYTFSGGTVSERSTSTVNNPSNRGTYGDLNVYGTGNGGNYRYYVLIDGEYYQITFNNWGQNINNFEATLNCSHTHETECYSCAYPGTSHAHGDGNCVYCSETEHIHGDGNCVYCSLTVHTHNEKCYSCGKVAHTHSAACKNVNAPYMEFIEADQDVLVEGDGSTVVNVYYRYKLFEIRFLYYRESNNGQKQIANLTNSGVISDSGWTTTNISGTPAVTDTSYTTGSEKIGSYTYYYISIRAKFGESIEDIWPSAVIGSVNNMYFGSWASEAGSGYRGNDPEHANIVGPYPYMNLDMMVPSYAKTPLKDENGNTIIDAETGQAVYLAQRMGAWWGNSGNNISKHCYHIYIEALGDDYDRIYEGKKYVLLETHEFTAAHNGTTRVDPFAYNGFVCVNDTREHGYNHQYDYQKNSSLYVNGSTSTDEEGHLLYDCPTNSCAYCNCFYYNRNTNTFAFYNFNAVMDGKGDENAAYGTPLSEYSISADDMQNKYYPNNLEPNAYEFGGWYTTPECFPGTEVNWDTLTMPDGDLTLYAKWTPVVRNVTFHLLYTDIDKGVYWYPSEVTDAEKPGYYPLEVPHGELLGTTYSHIPTREGEYQFIGWFYFDENGKKKFAPDSMKITRDMVLFAEWLSTIPTTYEIKYEAWDDKTQQKIEDIADKLEGYSTAGKTTTFNAKGGSALYDKAPPNSTSTTYQEQWFPEHSSHSVLMDEDSSKNTHTFKYYYKEYINYKVIHIDRATGTILHESEVKRTSNAIVTEKFMPFQDYLPESYYIEKAIAYDPTDYTQYPDHVQPENIIYFYYNEDTGHDPFRVEHYYQELDGTTWTLKFSENGIADNGETISRDSRNDTGFEFSYYTITTYTQNGSEWEENTVEGTSLPATGKVSVHGMEIKFYYTRKLVDYTVKYVEYGSNPENVLYTETFVGQKKFGEVVSVTAVTDFKDGEQTYIHVEGIDSSSEERTLTKEMREDAEDNVFVFYYNLKTFDIYYHVVCSAPGSEGLNGVSVSKQTVSVLNDSIRSTALTGTGFKFIGWFYDADCTNPVTGSDWLTDDGKTIIPQGISDEAHYYAKFEPLSGNLTIIKDVTNSDTETKDDNFLFHVKGQNVRNEYIDMIVSVTGENSVTLKDLPIGDYVVTELADWSWEYGIGDINKTQDIVITQDATTSVTFTNTDNNSNWLSGETVNENQFDVND